MTVAELIKELQACNPDDIVVMSSDAEGNAHSPLASLWEGTYVPDSTWSGEVYTRSPLTKEDKEAGYTEEDLYHGDDGVNVIVLGPTN